MMMMVMMMMSVWQEAKALAAGRSAGTRGVFTSNDDDGDDVCCRKRRRWQLDGQQELVASLPVMMVMVMMSVAGSEGAGSWTVSWNSWRLRTETDFTV